MAASPSSTGQPADTSRWLAPFRSARFRIMFWYILLLGIALFVSVTVLRQILIFRMEERIDRALAQEVSEFDQLSGGVNPDTGEPFGQDVESLFRVFFSRTVPDRNEVYLAIIDGEPELITPTPHYRIDRLDDDIPRWASVTEPLWETVNTPAGSARILAVPVNVAGEARASFVVAFFVRPEREEIDTAIRAAASVSGGVLLFASLVAWLAAGRILSPLRRLDNTARSISDSQLTARIDIRGNDEVASLARTFNAMLDRLEEAFAVQRRFLDDIGHELMTPITVVRGHLEVPGETETEREQSRAVILDELDRMQRMVDDLLTLARSERPGFLDLQEIDASELTDDLFARATRLGQRDWRLDEMADGRITADRHRLVQATMNLVQNAVRYTAPGTTIAIGSRLDDAEFRLWVRDTGPGITAEDRVRIFERFERGRQPRSEGTGLGLAIVRAIAEAHGGMVELESEPGQGATFTIVVPAGGELEV